ncbi:MAG: glycosyltransferase family 4 protein [Gammaproteobacteria bacterium]|nr:glycosyltransferase family 4 protein [Gammaproteobacteria bacterium]
MVELLFLAVVFIASWALVARFRAYALGKGLLDNPNARSSHTVATPRGGGMVFVAVWSVSALAVIVLDMWSSTQALVVLPAALLIAVVGYWDDHHHLAARWRALTHFVAASISIMALGGFNIIDLGVTALSLGVLGSLLAVIGIVWSVNLFNFMDGTDGIAGVEAVFVFGVGGLMLWQAGGAPLALMAWALMAAVLGFLVWNWPRARIFMGDGGSGFLGLAIAVFALAGETWFDVPAMLWLILYGVFWFDATVTLLRRVAHGERWYDAHRSHAYQRLHHGMGWSHAQVLAGVIIINTLLAAIALWADSDRVMIPWALLIAVILLATAYLAVERGASMYADPAS